MIIYYDNLFARPQRYIDYYYFKFKFTTILDKKNKLS